MPQLGGPVQVVAALGRLDLAPQLLDLLTQALQPADRLPLGLPLGGHRVGLGAQVGELLAERLQALLAGGVVLLAERRLLDLELHHAAGDRVQLLRHRVDLGADHGTRLVHQVDRLVGQEAVGDVAMRQGRRGHQRGILDPDAVMHLIALAQPAQDRDRVLERRLVHGQGLEPPLERRVLFDVLAVLGEGGRPDAVQLTAGEHRLQHVAGVHRALCRTRSHDGVQLVDEHDDPALRALDLRQHGLEALLELAAILGARHQQAQIEREDRLVLQPLGDVAAHDALGEPLHDRGLADTGIADQDRVVLRLSRQDLDHAADLGVAADHRIHLPGARLHDEVAPVLLERLVRDLRVRAGDALIAAHLGEDLEEALARHTMLLQQPPGSGLRPGLDHREQHVLDGHVLVLQPVGLPLGRVQQLSQACARRTPRRASRRGR